VEGAGASPPRDRARSRGVTAPRSRSDRSCKVRPRDFVARAADSPALRLSLRCCCVALVLCPSAIILPLRSQPLTISVRAVAFVPPCLDASVP